MYLHVLAQSVYNRRKAGVSSAIALAVLVPFIICAGCFLVHMRGTIVEKYNTHRYGGNYNSTRGGNKTDFARLAANHNGTSADSGQDNGRKASKHEGTYFTNEPIENPYTDN